MKNFNLPDRVMYILDRIESIGHRADVVGGPVRDFLLGKAPYDYDITTDATPDEVKEIFSDHRTVDTGIKHGTVTLVLDGENYEITTYRIDGEYKDSRHPETVSFTTSLREDLSRRDFTMNAIAYNPRRGITDCHGGVEDVKSGVIRAVGDPRKRFTEDALRILRGIRFASVLGFKLDDATKQASIELRHLLSAVSAERIFTEWKKLVSGEFAYEVITEYKSVIEVFLPELKDMRLPTRERFDNAEPFVRMLSLFYTGMDTCGKDYRNAMLRLHTDSATRDAGALVLDSVGKFDTGTAYGIKKIMSEYDSEIARLTLMLESLLEVGNDGSIEMYNQIVESREPYRTVDLDLNGNDLASLGYRGTQIGKEMRALLDRVMRGDLKNERKALLSAASANAPTVD